MKHLKTLWLEKKYLHFHQFIFYICGDELINDDQFLFWLCDKLKMNHRCTRLIQSIRKARENNFSNIRGWSTLSFELKQKIYDLWLANSIPSTAGRNGRNVVSIPKERFLQKFDENLQSPNVNIEEKMNRRGKLQLVANRYIFGFCFERMRPPIISSCAQWKMGLIS